MGPLLLRVIFGGRWLDGVDTLSKPGIHHLPVEVRRGVTDAVLDLVMTPEAPVDLLLLTPPDKSLY